MQRVTEKDLKRGETVYLRKHSEGGWCLLVERDKSTHTVMMYNDDRPRRFDSRWEAWSYCQHYGFVLEGWDEFVPKTESRHHHIPSRKEPYPTPDPEGLNREVGELIREVARRKTPDEIEWLELLIADDLRWLELLGDLRGRLQIWLSDEIRRRKALGPKSCTCNRCIDRLSSSLREVEEEMAKLRLCLG